MEKQAHSDADGVDVLVQKWLRRARENQAAHYEAYRAYARWHYWISVPVVLLTSIVGTTVFATLQKEVSLSARLAVGAISVLAAVLSGLQAFLRYGERSEKHRTCGLGFGAIRRHIEAWQHLPTEMRDDPKTFVESVRQALDVQAKELGYPTWAWEAAQRQLKTEDSRVRER